MRCNIVLADVGIADGEKQFWEKSLLRINRIHVPLSGGAVYDGMSGKTELRRGNAYVLNNSLARNFELLPGDAYHHLYIDFQTFPPIMGSDVVEISLDDDGVVRNLIGAVHATIFEYSTDNTINVKAENY